MKKLLFALIAIFSYGLCQAENPVNLEADDNYPTGYIKGTTPYYFGTKDGVLYVFSGSSPFILVRFPAGDTRESFTIPNTVARIARGAFSGCHNLQELVIPTSVYYIADNAFEDTEIVSFKVSGHDSAAVPGLNADTKDVDQYYNLSGVLLSEPTQGVNIHVSNGNANKILVR